MVAKTYSKESGEIKGMEQDCREQASYDETEELKEERKSCAEEAFSQKSREIKGAAQLYRERDAFEKEKGEKEAGTLESEDSLTKICVSIFRFTNSRLNRRTVRAISLFVAGQPSCFGPTQFQCPSGSLKGQM